jgi:hypothetical protein
MSGADLGQDDLGGAPLDARNRAQQVNGRGEGDQALLDGVREPLDLLVQEVQVGEDRADQQRVDGVEAALQRLSQLGQLLAQATLGEIGEDVGVGGAGH